jgi:hypothetical protein
MADQAVIDAVKTELPDEASDFGFDDTLIGSLLDSGLSKNKTILAAWRGIAAKTAMFTDVSESGSQRNLSVLNQNAREMVTYWQAQVDREDAQAGTFQKQRFASHTLTRPTTKIP